LRASLGFGQCRHDPYQTFPNTRNLKEITQKHQLIMYTTQRRINLRWEPNNYSKSNVDIEIKEKMQIAHFYQTRRMLEAIYHSFSFHKA
jgi:hypothetical protein